MPPGAPEVSSRTCTPDGPTVEHSEHNGRHRIVICTNRIEAQARAGAEVAVNAGKIERDARASALAGLRAARASIAANRDMGDEARRGALEGIDEAMVEVQTETDRD